MLGNHWLWLPDAPAPALLPAPVVRARDLESVASKRLSLASWLQLLSMADLADLLSSHYFGQIGEDGERQEL